MVRLGMWVNSLALEKPTYQFRASYCAWKPQKSLWWDGCGLVGWGGCPDKFQGSAQIKLNNISQIIEEKKVFLKQIFEELHMINESFDHLKYSVHIRFIRNIYTMYSVSFRYNPNTVNPYSVYKKTESEQFQFLFSL